MAIKANRIKVRITFIEDILGALPGDKEVYKNFIASKAPDAPGRAERIQAEIESVGLDDAMDKKMTQFARNKDGEPVIHSYVIKGFFKSAAKTINQTSAKTSKEYLAAYKGKIDTQIIPSSKDCLLVSDPGIVVHLPEGGQITVLERPLRAETMQGPRTALASSECIPAGSWIEFYLFILGEDMPKRIPGYLDYGVINGLGQWRNSGKGRFQYEILEDTTVNLK